MRYTKQKPPVAGWYWCKNVDPDSESGVWEQSEVGS